MIKLKKDLKMKTKLYVSFGIIILLSCMLTVMSVVIMRSSNAEMKFITGEELEKIVYINQAKASINDFYRAYKNCLVDTDKNLINKDMENTSIGLQKYEEAFNELKKLIKTDKGIELAKNLDGEGKNTENLFKELNSTVTRSDLSEEEITKISNVLEEQQVKFLNVLKIMDEAINSEMKSLGNKTVDNLNKGTIEIIILLIIMIIISIGIVIRLSKHINKSLKIVKELAVRLSNFDLSKNAELLKEDEFGETINELNIAQENIKGIISILSQGAYDLSSNSEELASAVEEITGQFDTIKDSTVFIAKETNEAGEISDTVKISIKDIDTHTNELTNKSMEGSNQASNIRDRALKVKKIAQSASVDANILYKEQANKIHKSIEEGKVVSEIKMLADAIAGIAEQTNLLALNAAIEAARVGES